MNDDCFDTIIQSHLPSLIRSIVADNATNNKGPLSTGLVASELDRGESQGMLV